MKKIMPNVITVCEGCEFRHVGCHSTCQPYLEQKAEQDRCREKDRGYRNELAHMSRELRWRQVKRKSK